MGKNEYNHSEGERRDQFKDRGEKMDPHRQYGIYSSIQGERQTAIALDCCMAEYLFGYIIPGISVF